MATRHAQTRMQRVVFAANMDFARWRIENGGRKGETLHISPTQNQQEKQSALVRIE
jgi:hypothetical protein